MFITGPHRVEGLQKYKGNRASIYTLRLVSNYQLTYQHYSANYALSGTALIERKNTHKMSGSLCTYQWY